MILFKKNTEFNLSISCILFIVGLFSTILTQIHGQDLASFTIEKKIKEFWIEEKNIISEVKIGAFESSHKYHNDFLLMYVYYLLRNKEIEDSKNIYKKIDQKKLHPFNALYYHSYPSKVDLGAGMVDEALEKEFKLLNKYESQKNNLAIAHTKVNISKIYLDFKQYNNTLNIAKPLIEIRTNDLYIQFFQSLAINNIIPYYGQKGDFDSTRFFISKLKEIALEIRNNNFLANAFIFESNILLDQGNINEALILARKAIELRKNTMYKQYLIADQLYLAEILTLKQDFDGVVFILNSLLKTGEIFKSKALHLSYLERRYRLHEKRQNSDSSLKYYKEYAALKEIILNEKVLQAKENLEIKYKTKNQQNIILKQQRDLLNEKKNNQLIIGSVTISGLLALSLFLFITLRNNERWNQKLMKEQMKATKRMVYYEEKQKQDMSMNLHDNIGQLLTVVKLKLNLVDNDQDSKNNNESIGMAIKLLDRSIFEMRNISRLLSPIGVERKGIRFAIIELARSAIPYDIKYNLDIGELDDKLNNLIKIHIYRITQELINNTIKYSKAKNIYLLINIEKENSVSYKYCDNGIGMDLELDNLNLGMGLENIRNRLKLMDAKYNFYSENNKGFTLNFNIQINKNNFD